MQHRAIAIFLTILIGFQALFGGLNGAVILCLGGGHEHQQSETVNLCELACGHAESLFTPESTDEHGTDCGCIDIEFGLVELLSLPRSDDGSMSIGIAELAPNWVVTELGLGLSWTGPPRQPAWFHPNIAQRLAIVSSTRLIL